MYIRYIRIPGLRAHTRGPWFHPKIKSLPDKGVNGLGFRALGVSGLGSHHAGGDVGALTVTVEEGFGGS